MRRLETKVEVQSFEFNKHTIREEPYKEIRIIDYPETVYQSITEVSQIFSKFRYDTDVEWKQSTGMANEDEMAAQDIFLSRPLRLTRTQSTFSRTFRRY